MNKRLLALVVVLPLSLATACGDPADEFTGKSAKEILTAAVADTKDVASARMAGTIATDGQELELDLKIGEDASCEGRITAGDVGEMDILVTGEDAYLKADPEVFQSMLGPQAGEALDQIGDKWLSMPGGMGTDGFCDLDSLLENLDEDKISDDAKKGEVSEIDGTEVIAINAPTEEEKDSTIYVATGEKHYIVRVERKDEGSLTLSEFDEELNIEAPAEDEIFDLSQLGG